MSNTYPTTEADTVTEGDTLTPAPDTDPELWREIELVRIVQGGVSDYVNGRANELLVAMQKDGADVIGVHFAMTSEGEAGLTMEPVYAVCIVYVIPLSRLATWPHL